LSYNKEFYTPRGRAADEGFMSRKSKTITVSDKMQRGYRYALAARAGRDFDPEFRPELTPKEMLALGVFGGKYMTDCRKEFPPSWFSRAKLSPAMRDPAINCFGVRASQPLSVWRKKGWIHSDDPRGWFQWYCRYYLGRRMPEEDARQIKRWKAIHATSRRSRNIASRVIPCAARASAKHCCTGLTTAGKFERADAVPLAGCVTSTASQCRLPTAGLRYWRAFCEP
jgi:hypothetical protein